MLSTPDLIHDADEFYYLYSARAQYIYVSISTYTCVGTLWLASAWKHNLYHLKAHHIYTMISSLLCRSTIMQVVNALFHRP
jgi:hypothetical protein